SSASDCAARCRVVALSPRLLPRPIKTLNAAASVVIFAGAAAWPTPTSLAGGRFLSEAAHQLFAVVLVSLLVLRPPVAQAGRQLTALFTQQQEVLGGAEAWMCNQCLGASAMALVEAFLQFPDFAHHGGETLRDRGDVALFVQCLAGRLGQCRRIGYAVLQVLFQARLHGRPQQHRAKKRWR